MTYTALASLLILGDDLSRIDKRAIVEGLKELQLPNGSFMAVLDSESDMRFVYCAAATCYMIQDWSGMDIEKAVDFILRSWVSINLGKCVQIKYRINFNFQSYEGAFAQTPGNEAHGGSTFCAIASLHLLNILKDVLSKKQIDTLRRWCVLKQSTGFQGRPGKAPDTCYSFWIGATLKILDSYTFINMSENLQFMLLTQSDITGGFAKHPDSSPGGYMQL